MRKIVVVNQSSGYLLTDILNAYVQEYDEVVQIYGTIKPNQRTLDPRVKLEQICPYDRSSAIKRIVTWLKGTSQIYHLLKTKYQDYEIVYVTNPPMGYLCSLRLKNPFSVIVFDTYPDALSNIRIKKGNPIFSIWAKWNRKLFARAMAVFTLSDGMADRLANYMSRDKIRVVPCWPANSDFAPITKSDNPFVREHNLENKFIVLYSGNMGKTHNVQVLVECAKRLRNEEKVHFLLIGGGMKKAELEQTVRDESLTNCTFMDWLPADQLPYSLASADLGVVSLNDETALVSVPSKTYNLLAVGAPLLCIAPHQSEIAKMVAQYNNGKCFQPSEIDVIVKFITELAQNNDTKERMSRNSLEASKNFTYENAKQYIVK